MSSNRGPRSLGVSLSGLLPGATAGPKMSPDEWAKHLKAEQLVAGEESRRDQIQARFDAFHGRRPTNLARSYPLSVKSKAWAGQLGSGEYPGVLWLLGVRGSGKTTRSWDTAEAAIRAGYKGAILVANAGDLWEAFAPPVDVEARRRYATVGLLILDDMGRAGASGWEQGHLWWALDQRTQWQRPTIINTNKHLSDVVDKPTWSRLQERLVKDSLGFIDHRTGEDLSEEVDQ